MAKKQTKKVEVEEPYVEEKVMVEQAPEQIQVESKPKRMEPKNLRAEDGWEIKDRIYHLKGKTPLSKLLKGSNTYWFDQEKGYEREVKYCSNQTTCFVDEMKGDQRLEHIIFRNGNLAVPKNKVVLQKLL